MHPAHAAASWLAAGKLAATLAGTGRTYVNSVAFLPDGTLIAGDDSGTAFWDTATGKIIATMPGPGGEAHGPVSVAFGPRGTFAACAIRNCYLWDITFYRHS